MSENKKTHKIKNYQNLLGIKILHLIKYPLILFVLTAALYGNTLLNRYAIDDPLVTNNPIVQKGVKGIPEIFTTRYRIQGEYNYGYRPVAKSTYAIEYHFFGQNPMISHLINLLLYGFTCIFLFYLLRKLLKRYDEFLPFVITLFFVAHPVHAEVVASLKNREEILSFLGSISSLYFFVKFNETKYLRNLIFGLLCYVLAFFSKQNALTFVAIIPLTIYFFSDTPKGFAKDVVKYLYDKISAYSGFVVSVLKAHFGFLIRLLINNKFLVIAVVCYLVAIAKGGSGFYEWTTFFIIVHFNTNTKNKVSNLFNGLVNKWVILGFLFVIVYSILGILKNPALISLSILHDLVGVLSVISFATYSFKDNPQMITKILSGFKNPFVIISIITGVIAITLSSYNYYFILVILLYNLAIACLLVFFIRNHYNSKGIKALSLFTIAKSVMKPISTQGFVIPKIFKVLLFLIAVLGLVSYMVMYGPNQYLPTEQREIFAYENPLFYESDIWVNIATGFYSLLIYLKLLVYPHPLVFYYGFNHIPIVSMTNVWVIFSVILHIALFVFALLGLRQKRLISFAILYYLATISIFANIVIPIPGIVGERLLFMPSLGFSIFLGLVVYRLLSLSVFDKLIVKNKIKILVVTMIILIPYSYKTIARNFNWKDHLTLYLHDIPYLENSLHANSLVASHLLRDINPNPVNAEEKEENTKKLNLAIKHFNQVLFLDPNDKRTLNNLGTIYYDFYKEYDKAIPYFQKALKVDSSFSYAWFNKGYCYEQLGNHHNAKFAYQQAMKIKNDDIKTISSLARVCFSLGELNRAKELNMLITKIDPLLDLPYLNMAGYHLKLGNETSAVLYFEEAVKINPSNIPLCKKLGDYFNELGNTEKATYYHQLAEPNNN